MLRSMFFVLVTLAMALPTEAAVKTRAIAYRDGDVELEGTLAWDDAATGQRPAVLVVHEWWGLNDYARDRAKKLAKMGYVAFALDMYGKGKLTEKPAEAREMATALRMDTMAWRRRAVAGLDVLRKLENVDSSRVAAIGYCFGGSTCLQLAYAGEDLKAVATFHAALPPVTADEAKAIKGQLLICHGADDSFIPESAIKGFMAALDKAKVPYEFVAYPGVRHSFTVPTADDRMIEGMKYDKAADDDSWKKMTALFEKTLMKK